MIVIEKETSYTIHQEGVTFTDINLLKQYVNLITLNKIKDKLHKLNTKISDKRKVRDDYQTSLMFISSLSWDDMLELRDEINRQEKELQNINQSL